MRLGEFLRAKERANDREVPLPTVQETLAGQVVSLPIDQIRPNPYQPRQSFDDDRLEELAQSIKENGLLQPIVVRSAEGGYELLMGERRLRACQQLGHSHVEAIIRTADNEDSAVMALIENLQREDLSLFDEVDAMQRLVSEFHLSQQDLSKALGMSQSTVANKLRLLKLDPQTREIVAANGLTERHARALLAFDDSEVQVKAAAYVADRGLNVRQTEEWIALQLEQESRPKRRQTIRGVYKDARLFVNSVKSLVKQLEQAGVGVELAEEATGEYVEVRVRIRTGKGDD